MREPRRRLTARTSLKDVFLGVALAIAVGGCGDDAPGDESDAGVGIDGSTTAPSSLRGLRYCEILLVYLADGELTAEVWGTQGLNLCPAESWDALDPDAIQEEYGATGIKMNGPRYFVVDWGSGAELPAEAPRVYGGELEMRLLATVALGAPTGLPSAYGPITVRRTNTWLFRAGSEIYELTDSEGTGYVMQAYSQIVDPTLDESDLPNLGERLALPEGWSFRAIVLEEDLELRAEGEVIVIQDELENTYQRR